MVHSMARDDKMEVDHRDSHLNRKEIHAAVNEMTVGKASVDRFPDWVKYRDEG